MACDKFESEGLLFCAGELSAEQSVSYESHLGECEECSREVKEYTEMFGEFSASDLLAEVPSAQCDAKIIVALEEEAVRQSKPVVSFGGIFTLFIQRVAVPAAIFLIALTVGLQISHKSSDNAASIAKTQDSVAVHEDSIADTGRTFIQGGSTGVIPVTLEEK